MAVEEIDLRSLADKDLVEQMHADLYDGLKDEIEEGVRITVSMRSRDKTNIGAIEAVA